MDGRLRHRGVLKVHCHRRLFREAEEHTLAVDRMREEEPFRDDRLVQHALSAVVDGSFEHVEVAQPDGLVLIRAGRIEILDDDTIFLESVLQPSVAEERERGRRAPDLLARLLGAEDPLAPFAARPESVSEIARGEPAGSPLAALRSPTKTFNFADCVTRMLLSN